ncbi:hypothetical protein HDV03_002338 [Kappamyces sp. JEL0829]|nr:hypothetical protein HDV03_002338 [Kappamyces sp. JEL0829]
MPNWDTATPRYCESILVPGPEYWNSYTAITMLVIGSFGTFYTSRFYPHPSIRQLFMVMVINGVGSFAFHWTGQYAWSKVDAWTMVVFPMISIPLTIESIVFEYAKRRQRLQDEMCSSVDCSQATLPADTSENMLRIHRNPESDSLEGSADSLPPGSVGSTESGTGKLGLRIRTNQDPPNACNEAETTPVSSSIIPNPPAFFSSSPRPLDAPLVIDIVEDDQIKVRKSLSKKSARMVEERAGQFRSVGPLFGIQAVLFFLVTSTNVMSLILNAVQIDNLILFIGTLLVALNLTMFIVFGSHRTFLEHHPQGKLVKKYVIFFFTLVLFSGICWVTGEGELCTRYPAIMSKIPLHAVWHLGCTYGLYLYIQIVSLFEADRFGWDAEIYQPKDGGHLMVWLWTAVCLVEWKRKHAA